MVYSLKSKYTKTMNLNFHKLQVRKRKLGNSEHGSIDKRLQMQIESVYKT